MGFLKDEGASLQRPPLRGATGQLSSQPPAQGQTSGPTTLTLRVQTQGQCRPSGLRGAQAAALKPCLGPGDGAEQGAEASLKPRPASRS